MMETLLFILFLIRLILANLPFVFQLLAIRVLRYKLLLLSLIIFSLTLAWALPQLGVIAPRQAKHSPLPPIDQELKLVNQPLLSFYATQEELKAEQAYYQELLAKQPSHQGALLNLALIEHALGNENEYLNYLRQAKINNPNWEIFTH